MNNEELKNKIVEFLKKAMEPIEYGGDGEHAPEVHYPTEEEIADALIAAGIGYVKDLQAQVNTLEITNIALQAGYDDAEKDRLYWVDKYKEAEHRAEKYERALELMARGECTFASPEYYLKQAEKQLAEDRKDG